VDAGLAGALVIRREEIIGDCRLILGDCLEVLPTLGPVDAVVTDPPYGNKHGGDSARFSGGNTRRGKGSTHGPIVGDGLPFDPRPIMLGTSQIIWGANYVPQHLQPGSLLVWSKRRPHAYGTFLGDGEVAWFSRGTGIYLFEHTFAGSSAALEHHGNAYAPSAHPFQKPIAVMEWCLQKVPEARTILDPYMGSGTTGVACAQMGLGFVGVEIDPPHFDTACRRVEEAVRSPRMFIAPPTPLKQEAMDL
jgi:site-specific DNA-methyltransferase (adenine-specific)